ncbi:MAG: GDSL-type esterase/lipase family protein [Methylococcales bacterium]|nr:GDSL-type esterase/lipase family protein [Methylococcales bacterium]
MKKSFLLVFLLFLTGCDTPIISLAKLPYNAVILAFGDSLTYGVGATPEHDYPAVLAGLAAREVINEGVPGEISSEGLNRLPALLDEYQPNLLILIHGGNDLLRKIPNAQTADNLKKMIAEAQNRHIAVVMLGVPKPELFDLKSAEFYQLIAIDQHILADLDTLPEILSDQHLKSDTIHPNDEGYQLMAVNLFNLLKRAGAL